MALSMTLQAIFAATTLIAAIYRRNVFLFSASVCVGGETRYASVSDNSA